MAIQVLMFHDRSDQSQANRALTKATASLPDPNVVDIWALYPVPLALDLEVEVARLLAVDRLVLQFPVQWYSTPQLLKRWQHDVLTRMFYMHKGEEGDRLEDLTAAQSSNE
jgi:putative NADPH-quinone reductase